MIRLLLVLALVQAAPASGDFTAQDVLAFHRHYDAFFRDYFGCPRRAVDVSECKPASGTLNAREFQAAKEAAKGLFGLR